MPVSARAILGATTLAVFAGPAVAADYTAFYFLTRGKVAAVATQVLVSCPQTSTEPIGVETVGVIGVKYGADPSRRHAVSLSTNDLFVGRAVEMTLREDGTASALTLEAKGAGGEAVAAFSKAIASAVKLVGGLPPAVPQPLCKPEIAKAVNDAMALSDQIGRMETQLENKSGEEAVRARNEIDKARARLTALRAKLTITTPAAVDIPTNPAGDGPWAKDTAAVDFSSWFLDVSDGRVRALPGAYGFRLTVTASAAMAKAIRAAAPKGAPEKPGQHIAYVRPVPAAASLCALDGSDCGKAWDAVQTSAALPQISPLFYLPARSGLFANRSVKATFAESGAPTSISYRTQAQAGEVAKGLAGIVEAGEGLRDANQAKRERELKELKTKVDLEKAQDELDALLKD